MQTARRLLLACCAALALPGADFAAAAPGPGSPAPDFTLAARDGGKVSLADLKGQVVMINFWATWCGPCRQEMPLLAQLQAKYEPLGFTLKVDDKEVANYLYTDREVQALHRGGVQKLYLGNLKAGQHEIVAFFTGKGPHERDYRRGTTLKLDKTVGAKYVELRISDREAALQPEFVVRQWE
jgi:thiol-disulfide isomerase/thioredoxin